MCARSPGKNVDHQEPLAKDGMVAFGSFEIRLLEEGFEQQLNDLDRRRIDVVVEGIEGLDEADEDPRGLLGRRSNEYPLTFDQRTMFLYQVNIDK